MLNENNPPGAMRLLACTNGHNYNPRNIRKINLSNSPEYLEVQIVEDGQLKRRLATPEAVQAVIRADTAMNAAEFVSRLDRVIERGSGQWSARCPAHDDRSPSLSIRETEDGRTLLHCFAGCTVSDVLASVGLGLSDLFADDPNRDPNFKPRKPRLNGWLVLEALGHESLVVLMAADDIAHGRALSPDDRGRVKTAALRIQHVIGEAHVIR